MVFKGQRETTRDGILNGWTNYFQSLYAPSENEEFDNEFKCTIENNNTSFLRTNNVHEKHTALF